MWECISSIMTQIHYLPDARCLVTLQITKSGIKRSSLVAKLYSFNRDDGVFDCVFSDSTGVDNAAQSPVTAAYDIHSPNAVIVKCDTVHTRTHTSKQLVVLVCNQRNQNKKRFQLIALTVERNGEEDLTDVHFYLIYKYKYKFNPPCNERLDPGQFHLSTGPVVLWLSEDLGRLVYTTTSHMDHNDSINSHMGYSDSINSLDSPSTSRQGSPDVVAVCEYDIQRACVIDLLTVYQDPQSLAVFLTTGQQVTAMETESTDYCADIKFSVHQMNFCQPNQVFHKVDASSCLPTEYAEIARCALVVHMRVGRNKTHSADCNDNVVLLCTSYGQLLLFRNGETESCVKIPFSDVCQMVILHAFGGDEYVFIRSKECGTCAVALNSFEVVHTWSTMQQLTVGDFVGCGTDQAFMTEETNLLPRKFILTDLCAHQIDRMNQEVNISMDSTDNVQAAVYALSSRLQNVLMTLREAERMKQAKEDLINQTCLALKKMATAKTHVSSTSKGKLLPLLGCSSVSPNITSSMEAPSFVHVISTKFCIVYDRLVISMVVVNRTKRNVHNLGVSIFTGQNELEELCISECRTQTEPLTDLSQKKPSFMHLGTKRHKANPDIKHTPHPQPDHTKLHKADPDNEYTPHLQPDHITQLSSCTAIPKFGTNRETTLKLVLHWTVATSQRDHGDNRNPQVLEHSRCSICGGCVKLTANELIRGELYVPVDVDVCSKLTDEDIKHNLTALNTVQEQADLTVSSSVTNLSCLSHVMKQMNFTHHDTYNCWMVMTPGALYLTRIVVQQLNRNKSLLSVHTRDSAQTMLIIHTMYNLLPKDAIIIPFEDDLKQRHVIKRALHCLREEVNYASHCLQAVLSSSNPDQVTDDTRQKDRNTPEMVRQDFMKQKHNLVKQGKSSKMRCTSLPHSSHQTLNSLVTRTDEMMMELLKQS